jgi:hypothetical protein
MARHRPPSPAHERRAVYRCCNDARAERFRSRVGHSRRLPSERGRAWAETPAACQGSSRASAGVGLQRLLPFVQSGSEAVVGEGARRLLHSSRSSGLDLRSRSSSRLSHKPIRKVVRQSVVGPQCPDRPRTALLLGRSHEDSENSSSSSHRCTSKLFRTVCATASVHSRNDDGACEHYCFAGEQRSDERCAWLLLVLDMGRGSRP